MIYRFTLEIDIEADPIEPWSAEQVARDYLRHIIEEHELRDHVLDWHTKDVCAYGWARAELQERRAQAGATEPVLQQWTQKEIEAQIKEAHLAYEAFIAAGQHHGFNAESYWMASRGLLEGWLARTQAEYRSQSEPDRSTSGERTWHTQQLYQSPQGTTPPQVPPGDKP